MKKILLLLLISFGLLFAACSSTEQETITESTQTEQEIQPEVEETVETESTTEPETSGDVVEITIDSFNFGYSQEEIRVEAGQTVRLTLTNSGGNHDFVIDEIAGARTAIISTGDTDVIEFTPTEAGEFFFYCSVGSHRAAGMEGVLIVE